MSQSLIGNVIPIDIDLDIDVSGGESQSLIGNVIHFMILMYSKLLSMSQSLIGNVIRINYSNIKNITKKVSIPHM